MIDRSTDPLVGDLCPFCYGQNISFKSEDVMLYLEKEIGYADLFSRSRARGITCGLCNEGKTTEETVSLWEATEKAVEESQEDP